MLDRRPIERAERLDRMCWPGRKQASVPSVKVDQSRCSVRDWMVGQMLSLHRQLMMLVRTLSSVRDLKVVRTQSLHLPTQTTGRMLQAERAFQRQMPDRMWIVEQLIDQKQACQRLILAGLLQKAGRSQMPLLVLLLGHRKDFVVELVARLSLCFPCRCDWDVGLCRR